MRQPEDQRDGLWERAICGGNPALAIDLYGGRDDHVLGSGGPSCDYGDGLETLVALMHVFEGLQSTLRQWAGLSCEQFSWTPTPN